MLSDGARIVLKMQQCFDDASAVIAKRVVELSGASLVRRRTMSRVGIEPTTYRLKVCCSTS